jgi:hypothetical protein
MNHTDIQTLGKPIYFNVDSFLETVEQFIGADEVSTALYLLDNMPGWYRDNPPAKAVELKKHLLKKFFTNVDYAKDGLSIDPLIRNPQDVEIYFETERGQLTHQVIVELNKQKQPPWIYELGPGAYWIPFMLKKLGLDFNYFGPSLNTPLQLDMSVYLDETWAKRPRDNQSKVFICFEMLEHLVDPGEIYHHYIKAGDDFDRILLSTPMYTYGGGHTDWRNMDLGHLRTYTPKEFFMFAHKYWPNHEWVLYQGPVMCLEGRKK